MDINYDGNKDLILANRNNQSNYIYLNNGKLGFNEKILFGTGNDNTRSLQLDDFNLDGYIDIAIANINEANVIYFGDKDLKFKKGIVFDTSLSSSFSITSDDFDNDGDPDIAIGNSPGKNFIFLNLNYGENWQQIILSKKLLFLAISTDQAIIGLPQKFLIFFFGIRLLPPLAGIMQYFI